MFGLSAAAAVLQGLLMACLPPTPHFLMLKGQEAEAERVIVKLKLSTNPRQKMANIRHSIQVWSLSSFQVSRQLFTNDSNQNSSMFLLVTSLMALANTAF